MKQSFSTFLAEFKRKVPDTVSKKVNSVERLTRHLNNGTSSTALKSYLTAIRKWAPQEPVIHIDDSDVVKPDGYKFEALGLVRDGSKSTASKTVYEKGYHVTEACVLTKNNHPTDLLLAGITQLVTVLVADKIHKHQYIRSLKPLIA